MSSYLRRPQKSLHHERRNNLRVGMRLWALTTAPGCLGVGAIQEAARRNLQLALQTTSSEHTPAKSSKSQCGGSGIRWRLRFYGCLCQAAPEQRERARLRSERCERATERARMQAEAAHILSRSPKRGLK